MQNESKAENFEPSDECRRIGRALAKFIKGQIVEADARALGDLSLSEPHTQASRA